MFFGWMRTNGVRNVCLFNTVKIKVCSPVITTDWDRPSQATVTHSVIPLRQQPWLTNWTTLTGIASFSSYYCRWSLRFKLTKLVSIHQILIIMDSRGTLLYVTVGTRLPSLPKLKPCRVSTGLLSQYLTEMNQNWPSLHVNLKSSGSKLHNVYILFPVPFFGWMRKNGGRRGPRPNKQKTETNKTKNPLTKLTTIIWKTTTNKQTKTYQQMSEQTKQQQTKKLARKQLNETGIHDWPTLNVDIMSATRHARTYTLTQAVTTPPPSARPPLFSPTSITPFSIVIYRIYVPG